MRRLIITPSSMPVVPESGPLLEFIRQAQLSLVYAGQAGRPARAGHGSGRARTSSAVAHASAWRANSRACPSE